MLLPDSIHPENSIYYVGSIIIKHLRDDKKLDLFELYSKMKGKEDISFPVTILAIDWLYLIGVVEMNEESKIKLCF